MRKIRVLIALFLIIGIGFSQNKAVQADFGTNWIATMFPNTTLSGAGVTVTGVNAIYFDWDGGPITINSTGLTDCPNSPTCTDNFSVRFTSTQNFSAGDYHFIVASDDGIRIYIDGAMVLDVFVPRGRTYDFFNYEMTAGLHNIVVEYFEATGLAMVQVQWFPSNITATLTPSAPTRNYFVVRDVPLTWSHISWATGYEIQVSMTIDFQVVAYHDDTLSADTLTITTTPLINGLYFWRVRAKKQSGDWGGWSATNSFQVNAP
jgi:hypothetical protein